MFDEVLIDGVVISFDKLSGRVYRMSHWERCQEFDNRGYLRRVFYENLWGHTEYYITDKALNYAHCDMCNERAICVLG